MLRLDNGLDAWLGLACTLFNITLHIPPIVVYDVAPFIILYLTSRLREVCLPLPSSESLNMLHPILKVNTAPGVWVT